MYRCLQVIIYRIAGIFRGRKLLQIGGKMDFTEKTLVNCSLIPPIYCSLSLQTIMEKTFADRYKQ